jgi:hypothetical protein
MYFSELLTLMSLGTFEEVCSAGTGFAPAPIVFCRLILYFRSSSDFDKHDGYTVAYQPTL